MTRFEKHRKKNFSEWCEILKSKFENVRTYEYKGYDIITYSGEFHGFGYMIFKDQSLVRERRLNYYKDAESHVFRYIDEVGVVTQK